MLPYIFFTRKNISDIVGFLATLEAMQRLAVQQDKFQTFVGALDPKHADIALEYFRRRDGYIKEFSAARTV